MTIRKLKRFCSDARPGLTEPYSIGAFTYASEGRIMIRVPKLPDVAERIDAPKFVISGSEELFNNYLFDPTTFRELPEAPPENLIQCSECHGDGKFRHEDCEDCHGHLCDCCDGKGKIDKAESIPIEVGWHKVASRYIRLIASLPESKIAPSTKDELSPLAFSFNGGEGRVMPMRV